MLVMMDALASIAPRAITVEVSLPKTGMVGVDAPYTVSPKRKTGAALLAKLSLRFDLDAALGDGVMVDIACDGPSYAIKDHLPLLKRWLHKVRALHLKWPSRGGLLEVVSRMPLSQEITVVPDVTAVMSAQIQAQMFPLLEGQKGKRIIGIKVISTDSRALGVHQGVARNMLKCFEIVASLGLVLQWNYTSTAQSWIAAAILLAGTLFVVIYPICNKRKQRLGDVVAGTLVIVKPKAILLDDLALSEAQGGFTLDQAQLDIYGSYELQTLEAILRDPSKSQLHAAELEKVAKAIARRIGYSEHAIGADPRPFLMAFYREQRERLESRLLFAERRQDKYHSNAPRPK
ncbi:RDD family protein [Cypionkella sp. TWP1-2-1b2]|uniref:RDD family protein n=1 Tax=Cypionkella sp. TWP1-2-1b2 TaxID=2804675 RepID=UPI003CEFE5BA